MIADASMASSLLQILTNSTCSFILGLVGMPASGKTQAAYILQETLGFEFFRLSSVVRDELRACNIEENYINIEKMGRDLRDRFGDNAIVCRAAEKLQSLRPDRCCIDGIRSICEVTYLKQKFPSLILISIHSSPNLRLQRTVKVSPEMNDELFSWRDEQNLKLGMGEVIALADFVVNHEHNSRARFRRDLCNLIKYIAKRNTETTVRLA